MPTAGNPPYSNQSTEKALAIIELLSCSHEPMRLKDIASQLNLNSSTALRFLCSLQKCGYVEQDAESQKYYLTYKICGIANRVSMHNDLKAVAHPFIQALSNDIKETVCISVEQNMTMVYVDVAAGPDRMFMSLQKIGSSSPMHCTGNGKLLLSLYDEAGLDRYIREKGLASYTKNTLCTKKALSAELEKIRAEGIAYDNEECEEGIRCVSFPIFDYTDRVIAGLTATGPIYRITDKKMDEIKPRLKETAQKISAVLGYRHNFNN